MKKWKDAGEVLKMVHELPRNLKEYDKIMKEKPNFDKSKEGKFVNNEKGGKGVVLNGKNKNGIKTNKKFKSNL